MDCSKISIPDLDPFIDCDGLPLNNTWLKKKIKEAIEEENYEYAAMIRDELKRRKAKI